MGCSESKNVVEPDSKKPEEKPEEKTIAIVPVTFSLKFFNLGRFWNRMKIRNTLLMIGKLQIKSFLR